jgi:hypothetical protein
MRKDLGASGAGVFSLDCQRTRLNIVPARHPEKRDSLAASGD